MTYAIGATPEYGRNTFALLTKCQQCGRKYDGRENWQIRHVGTKLNDHWWLVCRECAGKEKL